MWSDIFGTKACLSSDDFARGPEYLVAYGWAGGAFASPVGIKVSDRFKQQMMFSVGCCSWAPCVFLFILQYLSLFRTVSCVGSSFWPHPLGVTFDAVAKMILNLVVGALLSEGSPVPWGNWSFWDGGPRWVGSETDRIWFSFFTSPDWSGVKLPFLFLSQQSGGIIEVLAMESLTQMLLKNSLQ